MRAPFSKRSLSRRIKTNDGGPKLKKEPNEDFPSTSPFFFFLFFLVNE